MSTSRGSLARGMRGLRGWCSAVLRQEVGRFSEGYPEGSEGETNDWRRAS